MKRIFRRLGETWAIVGITFLLLLLVEIFFRVYMSFNPVPDARAGADCYAGQDWVPAYFEEFRKCNSLQWEPYLYWKREPFEGEFITVDNQGHRATLTKAHPLARKHAGFTLFFMGGSAVWGTGVRDAFTLPSLTGNELTRNGFNPEIFNMGESGYVSSQDLLRLEFELKNGNIPDIVIFYGGLNDIFSSYQSGKAGLPQNEMHREAEFNTLQEKRKSIMVFLRSMKTLSTARFISSRFSQDRPVLREDFNGDLQNLADLTVHYYNENIRMANALAKEYGFQVLFYWQPSLFDKPFRTAYEEEQLERIQPLKPFLEEVNSLLFSEDLAYENIHFINLSNLFTNVREPIFIDWCHVGEAGNFMIARKMGSDILPLIDSLNTMRGGYNE